MAADLGKAYVQIIPSAKGISGSISSVLGGESEAAGKSAGSKIAGFAKKAIAAAGIGKAIIDTVKLGAAYEQAVGGIETLFKGSADKVIANADRAYKTAGISATKYMEQATSFSASLLQSVGGDTEKAAKYADTAIRDMADNANKMGTNIESIQDAYQGFAKQNYTMLDNLKLGYSGTKTEMERLLADASKISGQKYDISNLSDVYEAIHVIQGKLDITGTTSKEAASTLQGSFASMKAAAQDLGANLVSGRNIEASMKNLGSSASTFFFGNLVPALGTMFKQLPTMIGVFLQQGVPSLLSQIFKLIPKMLVGIGKVAGDLANQITKTLDSFASGGKLSGSAKKMITSFGKGLVKAIPIAVRGIGRLIIALVKATMKLPGKLLSAGIEAVKAFVKGLKKVRLPKFKITWSTESKKGEKGSLIKIPKPNLAWYKTGGIFSSPSVIGVGEAGSEAVVPLAEFWNKLEGFFKSKNNDGGGGGIVHLILQLDGKTIGQTVVEYINGQTIIFGESPITV